jgi:chemotaxis protein CheD
MLDERKKHYLFPSTIFVSKEPFEVTTVLGTCIAVCLYDPLMKVGGINHFMLPFWNGEGLPSPKYGNIAIQKLLEKLIKEGALRNNINAKIFGGWIKGDTQYMIGERNTLIAREILASMEIKIVSENVGGAEGRFLKFHTDTGNVFMKFNTAAEPVIQNVKN